MILNERTGSNDLKSENYLSTKENQIFVFIT